MAETSGAPPIPLAVVMITRDEAYHLPALFENIRGVASEVFIVDSYSSDETIDIALAHGAHVVQRRFRGFGDQWNFAMQGLPITAAWTMKLDPDERLSDELKAAIRAAVEAPHAEAFEFVRRLWFMGGPIPIRQKVLRLWRTGEARFSDVLVNERPLVAGGVATLNGTLEHLDSPTLHHWYDKQNSYTTMEAYGLFKGSAFSDTPRLLGSSLQRWMWVKSATTKLPLLPFLVFLYYLLVGGVWRAGRRGLLWAQHRREVYRMIRYKLAEMRALGQGYTPAARLDGMPDGRVPQCD